MLHDVAWLANVRYLQSKLTIACVLFHVFVLQKTQSNGQPPVVAQEEVKEIVAASKTATQIKAVKVRPKLRGIETEQVSYKFYLMVCLVMV